MNNTKKAFLYAGGILGIICAVMCIIAGVIFLMATSVIDFDFVNKVIADMNAVATTPEELIVLTEYQVRLIVKISRLVTVFSGVYLLGIGIASSIFSNKVIKLGKTRSDNNGAVITLLVLSVFVGNFLTMAFMITALCLKFNKNSANTSTSQEIAQ